MIFGLKILMLLNLQFEQVVSQLLKLLYQEKNNLDVFICRYVQVNKNRILLVRFFFMITFSEKLLYN